jgi:hypothetical protein
MNQQNKLSRCLNQIDALGRMIRTLRSEIEGQISSFSLSNIDGESEVYTGLGQLLVSNPSISPRDAQPYQDFAPGVCFSYGGEKGSCGATVALKVFHPYDLASSGSSRVSRFSINPVFSSINPPEWIILESILDIDSISSQKELIIDILSSFEIKRTQSSEFPRDLTLMLHASYPDNTSDNHLHYSIPVTSMPFEHRIVVKKADLESFNIDDAKNIKILLGMPTRGEYTLHIDHFSVRCIEG